VTSEFKWIVRGRNRGDDSSIGIPVTPYNLFYSEPNNDRWLPYDRYPRALVRRLVRGRPRPGGQMRVFLNLCEGLRRLGVPFRVNDYRFARAHPDALVCIIGKPFVLDRVKWRNPILFGAAIYSHPLDDPNLLKRLPVKKVLVPGPWMKEMCRPYWGDAVEVWPVGIDTDAWHPTPTTEKDTDVLLYDKVRWDHDRYTQSLIDPIRLFLRQRGISFREIRYGYYREEEFKDALRKCRAMIFLCEHETQGIAYQEALSSGVPIFAWDRGGPWQDPSYYPDRVAFGPVTSVPYWDERCGMRFKDWLEFEVMWDEFWRATEEKKFRPRDYILEHLTLERAADHYLQIAKSLQPCP